MSELLVDQETRAARNQALFREVNERLEALDHRLAGEAVRADWICECANVDCFQQLEMSLAEYEALRQQPTHFAIYIDGTHFAPEVERVVRRTDRYWVVEKLGKAARTAAALDPRESR